MKVFLCAPRADELGIWILEIGRVTLGLSRELGWSLRIGKEVRAIEGTQDMTLLLPLLEIGRQPIYRHLQLVANENPDIGPEVMAFPETLLLRCAFETSVSAYWPIKGVEWLDFCPHLVDRVADLLRKLQKRSWASQILKQKIKSTLRIKTP